MARTGHSACKTIVLWPEQPPRQRSTFVRGWCLTLAVCETHSAVVHRTVNEHKGTTEQNAATSIYQATVKKADGGACVQESITFFSFSFFWGDPGRQALQPGSTPRSFQTALSLPFAQSTCYASTRELSKLKGDARTVWIQPNPAYQSHLQSLSLSGVCAHPQLRP